jgi:hypothetical protein
MSHLHATFLSLAVLAPTAACESSPAPTAAAPVEIPSVAAAADPPPAPEPAAPVEAPVPSPPVAAAPVEVSPLRVVAVREGSVGLLRHRDTPVLTLEGEPVPWVDEAFTRRPSGGAGLSPEILPFTTQDTLTFAGDLDEPQGAWTTTARHYDRQDSTYATYHWKGGQWQPFERRKGVLLAHYATVVEREGAVLALQHWTIDPEQDLGGKKVQRSLARATPGFIRIAGAELDVPRIPDGLVVTTATTDERGTIFAVAREPGKDGWRDPTVVLAWPPGTREAQRVDAPDLDRAFGVRLVNDGEWTLIMGSIENGEDEPSQAYLAMGRAGQWQRVAVSLPGRFANERASIVGAARAPTGELWIGLDELDEDTPPIWRKPMGGEWQPVPLPTVGVEAFGPHEARVRDSADEERGWIDIERAPAGVEPMEITSVVGAAGAVWITGVLDLAYATGDVVETPRRNVVLTSLPGIAPIAILPPAWELQLERRTHLEKR